MNLTLDLLNDKATAGEVVGVAKGQIDGISNWRSAYGLDAIRNGYRSWTDEAVALLGNVLHRPAVFDWVFDDAYWRAISLAENRSMASAGPGQDVLYREAQRRTYQLEALIALAEEARDRWDDGALLAVLDTGVTLRFGDPGDDDGTSGAEVLDWDRTLDLRGAGTVRLVIPWTVLRELDQQKRNSNVGQQSAARNAIRRLNALGAATDRRVLRSQGFDRGPGGEVLAARSGVTVEMYARSEDHKTDDADLEIIRAAAYLHRVTRAGTVVFVTEDVNAQLRALVWGLAVCLLPDSGRDRNQRNASARKAAGTLSGVSGTASLG